MRYKFVADNKLVCLH